MKFKLLESTKQLNNILYESAPKSKNECKEFFLNQLKSFGLDKILQLTGSQVSSSISDTSPMFILPDGRFLDVSESVLDVIGEDDEAIHADYVELVLRDIYNELYMNGEIQDNNGDLEFADDFVSKAGYCDVNDVAYEMGNEFCEIFSLIRCNPGNSQVENRLYMVIPQKPTSQQYYSIEEFFEHFNDYRRKYQIFYKKGSQASNQYYHFETDYNRTSPEELVDQLKAFYSSGRELDNLLQESKEDQDALVKFAGQELADKFFRLKKRLKSPENDLYYWIKDGNVDKLKRKLDDLDSEVSNTQRKKLEKAGSEKLYEDSRWTVLRITTPEAAYRYGRDTAWCIASEEGYEYFDHATNGAGMYYIFDKENDTKYAVQVFDDGDYIIWIDTDDKFPYIKGCPHIDGLPDLSVISKKWEPQLSSITHGEKILDIMPCTADFFMMDGIGLYVKTDKNEYFIQQDNNYGHIQLEDKTEEFSDECDGDRELMMDEVRVIR